jgi:lipopolysaccharide transport system ATP-binding protein
MSYIAVRSQGLGKKFRISHETERYRTVRDTLSRGLTSALRFGRRAERRPAEDFWALRDLSFEIKHGDVVGIIGGNGAGKSTLLKILTRITEPSEGLAEIRGRVGALLEVGTGFHPELTGRENILLNGAILGMRKSEIISKFDEIVAFSEVERFLDTPVKHYSSGMYVRLAFAIAAHLEPEILIVDEVLAVGDVAFQKKCLGKIGDVSRGGRTVLFVSHNMAAVESLCNRGIVLDHGRLVFSGPVKEAVGYYYDSVSSTPEAESHVFDLAPCPHRRSKGSKLLKRIELFTEGDRPLTGEMIIGDRLRLRIHFELPVPASSFNIGLGFNNVYTQRIFTANSLFDRSRSEGERVGHQVFVCDIPEFTLMAGTYSIRIWLDINHMEVDLIDDAASVRVMESDYYGTGNMPRQGAIVLRHQWYLEDEAFAAKKAPATACASSSTRVI